MLPGMDGVEFRRVQQTDPAIAQVPVIVVSGVADMMRDIQSMGIACCFRKPVDLDALLGAVNEFCPAR